MKAERYMLMHEQELAFRALYKAQRAVGAMDPQEPALLIHLFEVMAATNITQKELLQAHDYIHRARLLQLELCKEAYEKQFQRK